VPLVLDAGTSIHRDLSGVSHDVEIAIWIDGAVAVRIAGAMLWTHVGVSGPAALNASRHWMRAQVDGRRAEVTVSFCPGLSFDEVDALWQQRARQHPKTSVQTALATLVPSSVAAAVLRQRGIDGSVALAHFPRDERRLLVHALVAWPLPVAATRGYNYAEVTAGGVALDEIDPVTMASRVCPGLYLVGEILDVDGRIGGFNFQWAWSSGFVAGRALARRVDSGMGNPYPRR
jgi:predicted Rossmann fold flavoprotein